MAKEKASNEVYEVISSKIRTGEWAPGYKLPSEPTLAEEFGVSRATVREALQELCRREDCVIATGGGGVLLPENRALLRRSGTVLWLDRDVERILQTDFSAGRPLLGQGAPALKRLAAERRELYDACAHHRIPDGDVNAVLSEILRIWREEHP